MNPFLKKLEQDTIKDAIAAAELKSSGEIRVMIHPGKPTDPQAAARKEFARFKMHRTKLRNAVLIMLAPKGRCFAIHADKGIYEACGESFWKATAAAMEDHFRAERFTEGIIAGVAAAGAELARFFPRSPDDRNELPDHIIDEG